MSNISNIDIELNVSGNAGEKFKETTESAESLNQALEPLKTIAEDIAAGFSKLDDLLSQLVSITSNIEGVTAKTQELNAMSLDNSVQQFEEIKSEIQELNTEISNIDGATFESGMDKVAKSLDKVAKKNEQAVKDTKKLKQELQELGTVGSNAHNKTAKSVSKHTKALSKLQTMIKRLIMYRIISGIFRAITNSIKEGINNAYQYSKAINGAFAQSMDKLATSSLYLKNSLGALASSFVQMIEPVLTWLMDNLADIFNFLSVVFAKLAGEDTALQAKKSLTEYAEATDSAATANENFKKSLAGFDELNNISSSATSAATATSGSANIGDMFYDIDISGMSWGDVADMEGFQKSLDTLKAIGLSIGVISGIFGKIKTSSIAVIIYFCIKVFEDIESISSEGANFDNITDLLSDLEGVAWGIAGLNGNLTAMGIIGAIKIVTDFVNQAPAIWKGITEGDWSDIDTSKLIEDGVLAVIFVATAINKFKKNKAVKTVAESGSEIQMATEGVSNTTSVFSSGMKKLAANMLLGIAILAEVIIAVGLFVAGIWGIGLLIQQVVIAWQPVLENAGTAATAIGIGTALLLVIGTVTALLGSLGGVGLIVPLALGIAILAEISASADLFLAEIWVIGLLLNKIAIAWQPVLDNGDTVTKGIEYGSAILLAIGVVTAALGALTVASAGLLPLAIALGTALLVELAVAVIEFTDSLSAVAYEIADVLSPALEHLNPVLPKTESNLKDFNKFMSKIAGVAVEFSKDSVIAGIADVVTKIVSFFTGNPIGNMAKNVKTNGTQAKSLNKNLAIANPELEEAVDLLTNYNKLLSKISALTKSATDIDLKNLKANLKTVGQNIVVGLANGLEDKKKTLSNALKEVLDDVLSTENGKKYGKTFGEAIATGISNGFKGAKFPKLSGTISTKLNNKVELDLKAYAMGGIVDSGQIFIANERGPELVGTIGNQTAVANQNQIVTAVSLGVYNAIVDAMSKTTQTQQPVSVVINGREVFKTVQSESKAYSKRTGQPAF